VVGWVWVVWLGWKMTFVPSSWYWIMIHVMTTSKSRPGSRSRSQIRSDGWGREGEKSKQVRALVNVSDIASVLMLYLAHPPCLHLLIFLFLLLDLLSLILLDAVKSVDWIILWKCCKCRYMQAVKICFWGNVNIFRLFDVVHRYLSVLSSKETKTKKFWKRNKNQKDKKLQKE